MQLVKVLSLNSCCFIHVIYFQHIVFLISDTLEQMMEEEESFAHIY